MEGFSVRMGKEGATRIAFGGYLMCFCLWAEPVLYPRTHRIVSTASCDALSRIRAYDPLKSVCQIMVDTEEGSIGADEAEVHVENPVQSHRAFLPIDCLTT